MKEIEVSMGKIAAAKNSGILTASAVGSCLVIVLYDNVSRNGVLAHAMLPKRMHEDTVHEQAKYVDCAIDEMIKKMSVLGLHRKDIEARIIGGANMFTNLEPNIGKENIKSAKEKLKRESIHLAGELTGGTHGCSVEFDVASGIVEVTIKF